MKELGRRGMNKVLFEGGARTAASALKAGVIDRVAFFVAPRIIGGGISAVDGLSFQRVRDALSMGRMVARPIGPDLLIEAEPSRPRSRKTS